MNDVSQHPSRFAVALNATIVSGAVIFALSQERNGMVLHIAGGWPAVACTIVVLAALGWYWARERIWRSAPSAEFLEDTELMGLADETLNVGHWQFNLRTAQLHWSDEMYRIHMWSKQDVTLEAARNAYVGADRERFVQVLATALERGDPYRIEGRIRRPDGSLRDVVSTGRVALASDGQPAVVFGALQDITDRKTVERERDRLIDRVSLANHVGKVGIFDWDIATNTLVWDCNMFALRGRDVTSANESIDTLLFETMHPDDRERIRSHVQLSIATDAPFDTEYRIVWPNGEIHSVRARGTVVRDAANVPLRMVGTNWDTTEVRGLAAQLRAEKEELLLAKRAAEEANAVKSDFLAGVSHEIRTPMNAIIGLTSILLESDPTLEQRLHLSVIADASRSLLAIINDVLDLSTFESGTIELEATQFRPAELVETALAIVRDDARMKGLDLHAQIAPDVPTWVTGDATRVRQILLNLLTNALKFTEKGQIDIRLERQSETDGDLLRFEVCDTGIGVALDRRHLLFQTFSQLDRSSCRKYGGAGIGLAIARRLTEAMSGTIGMHDGVVSGSVFWFTARLPRRVTPGTPVADLPPENAARRILVVDDNPINQLVARGLLVQDGHAVELAADGAAAVAAVASNTFDLVLMDMQMPVMDGIEATRRIRALEGAVRNIPIVALTANAMTEQVASCVGAGMNDHLAKPIDRERLRQAVTRWTRRADYQLR